MMTAHIVAVRVMSQLKLTEYILIMHMLIYMLVYTLYHVHMIVSYNSLQ